MWEGSANDIEEERGMIEEEAKEEIAAVSPVDTDIIMTKRIEP